MNVFAREGVVPLYTLPQAGEERSDELLSGMEAEVLEEAGSYCRVRTFYGYEGWAEKSALCVPSEEWEEAPKRMVTASFADAVASPRVQGRIVRTLPRGAQVGLPSVEEEKGFLRVLLCDGEDCWIPKQFLSPLPPPFSQRSEEAFRQAVTEAARLYLGVQYRWGGKTALGIDCSGLCAMAYLLCGAVIWRDAKILPGYSLRPVAPEKTRMGDLLFFPGHVVMRLEGDSYIHSTCGGGAHGVVCNSFCPEAPDYREDLSLDKAEGGTLFGG